MKIIILNVGGYRESDLTLFCSSVFYSNVDKITTISFASTDLAKIFWAPERSLQFKILPAMVIVMIGLIMK